MVTFMEKENVKLRSDLEMTKKQEDNEASMKVNEENVTEIKKECSEWKKIHESETVNFRHIIETEKQNKEENLTRDMIKVIKEKEILVRVKKEVYELKETIQRVKETREKIEKRGPRG